MTRTLNPPHSIPDKTLGEWIGRVLDARAQVALARLGLKGAVHAAADDADAPAAWAAWTLLEEIETHLEALAGEIDAASITTPRMAAQKGGA
jgi:hypothetical protein